jgi:RNA polymerase sigma-70 factor (ECF subfamily)
MPTVTHMPTVTQEIGDHNAGAAQVRAALAGDHAAFDLLTAPYRRELLVHCYRILGSLEDAEDVVQETWLRAWRRLASFEGRSSFRAWLYKIATHAALDAVDSRRRRVLPTATHAPADPTRPPMRAPGDVFWLEPLPDAYLLASTDSPEAVYDVRESVALAFLAALQHLSGRQRAVLILRDVLDWSAKEVADLLDITVAAVTSALQRARATMKSHRSDLSAGRPSPTDVAATATLLDQYVRAWENADTNRLVALLREDCVLTMPPPAAWYRGPAAIGTFLATQLFAGDARGRYRLVPTRSNGCPAFGVYAADTAGIFRPAALHVLTIGGGQIATLHGFIADDGRLFASFGLAPTMSRRPAS